MYGFDEYIVSQGYKPQPDQFGRKGEYSTLGVVSREFKKDNLSIIYGLGEYGLPPMIIYPKVPIYAMELFKDSNESRLLYLSEQSVFTLRLLKHLGNKKYLECLESGQGGKTDIYMSDKDKKYFMCKYTEDIKLMTISDFMEYAKEQEEKNNYNKKWIKK